MDDTLRIGIQKIESIYIGSYSIPLEKKVMTVMPTRTYQDIINIHDISGLEKVKTVPLVSPVHHLKQSTLKDLHKKYSK
jgi:hypothetical protein